jgi:colanic acid/amylovoran biosynthesis glycosyltransferase
VMRCTVCKNEGLAFRLVLIGDKAIGAIERPIAAFGLKAHIRITGWLSGFKVKEEFERAHALVLPRACRQ